MSVYLRIANREIHAARRSMAIYLRVTRAAVETLESTTEGTQPLPSALRQTGVWIERSSIMDWLRFSKGNAHRLSVEIVTTLPSRSRPAPADTAIWDTFDAGEKRPMWMEERWTLLDKEWRPLARILDEDLYSTLLYSPDVDGRRLGTLRLAKKAPRTLLSYLGFGDPAKAKLTVIDGVERKPSFDGVRPVDLAPLLDSTHPDIRTYGRLAVGMIAKR